MGKERGCGNGKVKREVMRGKEKEKGEGDGGKREGYI